MRPAIPFEIMLFERETEADLIPGEEVLRRLKVAFPDAEIDPERGRREVLQSMQKLLDLGAPEAMVQGYRGLAERTSHVTVCWPNWPGQSVTGHVSGLQPGLEELYFKSERHDFEFIRFAARQLAAALDMRFILRTPFNEAVETEAWPTCLDPREWIEAHYAELDEGHFIEDPTTGECLPAPRRHPVLREISDWPTRLQRAVRRYLEEYPRRNADAMTQGFDSFETYATAYVGEVDAFAPVRHCWSVDLDESHHNEVLIDHGDWLTLIDLSGVATRLFEA